MGLERLNLRAFPAITRSSPLEGTNVSLRIFALLLLTTSVMFAAALTASPAGSSQPDNCSPTTSLRSLHLTVPANRAITFPLAEIVAGEQRPASGWQAVVGLTGTDGALRVAPVTESADGNARITPSGLTFEPQRGFVGSSAGWIVAMYPDGSSPDAGLPACGGAARDEPSETVLVTFEVRNTLPVAFDDAVTMPTVAKTMDVGPESGVLANDIDWNGDRLVVHAAGVTSFPWGTVHLASDGSYRIVVTDSEMLAPATVRYLVWDQQGSPTSVDTGYLEIDFSEA